MQVFKFEWNKILYQKEKLTRPNKMAYKDIMLLSILNDFNVKSFFPFNTLENKTIILEINNPMCV